MRSPDITGSGTGPGTPTRCTEHEGHEGDHFHAYSREEWPHYEGETQ
ncbi:hypothetical protein ABCR94_31830 [Streptomyces sp. 21So2-11]